MERAVRPLAGAGAIGTLMARWDGCAEMATRVLETLVERPPLQLGEEATIAPGVDEELDQLRALRDGGKDAVARIQAEERARTGIASLKVGYNRVFGYFIEISNANRHLVPADYQRRQTLTGGERYVTPALKEYEERILTAAERIETRERELFEALRARGRTGDRAHPVCGAHRRRAGCAGVARGRRGPGGLCTTLADGRLRAGRSSADGIPSSSG